jgi:type I site-specific restriction endonuclease
MPPKPGSARPRSEEFSNTTVYSKYQNRKELELLIQRRSSRKVLSKAAINEAIVERFNVNYPHFKGEFARAITFKTEYAQNLIDNFSGKEKAPHIAISVDMLDTGIDIPAAINLVFFKLVRSKTKFWQMLGRGTRLCPDLFGPGKDKQFFFIFDYCQNLEFLSQNPETTEGALVESLGKKLFTTRLELLGELDKRRFADGTVTGIQDTCSSASIFDFNK